MTAFVTPWGLHEWVRIPFGLTNAPAVYQRYMEKVLEDYNHEICEVYLDDILIFSKTFEEHLDHIRKILQRAQQHRIKLKPSKCELFQREVRFLGKLVSESGYKADPKDTDALQVLKTKIPHTVGDLRKLLGMTGYYRRYLKDYSKRAKPLFDLLSGPKDLKKVVAPRTGRARPKDSNQVPSKTPIEWTSKHQIVLDSLIDDLATAPVMAYPDFSQPFVLHTDASQDGLGAVLYQRQGGVMRVIGGKLEFLALKWAITEQFRDYLYYAPTFTVYTDNNPLTYILTSAKLNATGHRWVAELADYHFSIKYRPGKNNADADTLSRLPLEVETMEKTCSEEISQRLCQR
ncbi:hypothetical protein BSL78_27116 [Apostichopus japonicus]|uniref:Reverse transcriptase domain-containing protein n=1 Tax=Stichopus japonicus TaxID=307972 RepID=A0A2G8JJX7_STIJA|nr:hypothetical protein BSL78_27116 [Apostichopus japonicus]